MRLTADTNVLVRAIVADDLNQARRAQEALASAEMIAITLATLCELVWVLSRAYSVAANDIAEAIRRILASGNVEADRPAIEAGLAVLEQGGDFADGVIAFEGERLGAHTFASFDKSAVKLLRQLGRSASLLA